MSLKLRAIKATIRAANRLRAKKNLKSLDPYQVQAKSEKGFTKTKFQPSKTGGREIHPQHVDFVTERPINQKTLGATIRRLPYVGGRESWRAEMARMFGGLHMSQDPKLLKKSIKILTKKRKKKKIKKATEGGEVVIHDNVDRSLL